MKITIIGAGNIGGSMAIGLASSKALPAENITVTARHATSLERFKEFGIRTSTDNVSAVSDADIIFYAVKPWQMEDALTQTAPALDYARQLVVCVSPVIVTGQLSAWLEKDGKLPGIAYVIPNTAVEIGESMSFISPVTATEAQTAMLKDLFDKTGLSLVVGVDRMLAGTSLASCGIAYAMRYISASIEGGLRLGFSREEVGGAVCQTVRGAVNLVEAKGYHSEKEIDRVCTPNGLTVRGLNAMENAGFSDAVIKGLTVVKTPRKHRIVVKVGSTVLTRPDGELDTTRVSSIVDQIVTLRKDGYEVILVTSGAVACGRAVISEDRKLNDVQQRQLYSAIGQVRLMDLYYKLFQAYEITVGQVLTMKKNFEEGQEYSNQKSCMEVMLQGNVLPVVNENDTVSITELMFTDNDELSGLVAEMVEAEALVILTNVDGVYDGPPDDPASKVIPRILPGEDLKNRISAKKSSIGRGGMVSKYAVASRLSEQGIRVIITNGNRDNILPEVLNNPARTPHTEFVPAAVQQD